MPGRSSPSHSRTSAMSAPTRTTSRPSTWRRRRARAGSSCTLRSPSGPATARPAPSSVFDLDALKKEAREWPGLVGMDLVPMVTSGQRFTWDETAWEWDKGYGRREGSEFHVVAIDYGIKRNILRQLAANGCKVTVVPAQTSAEDIV